MKRLCLSTLTFIDGYWDSASNMYLVPAKLFESDEAAYSWYEDVVMKDRAPTISDVLDGFVINPVGRIYYSLDEEYHMVWTEDA